MKEQEKTVRVRMMTQEKLEQENPQMAAKIRAAAEMIRANRTDCVAFHTEDGERKVAVSEIMYYMTDDRKLSVHTADGSFFQVKMTMKDMEELLKRENFLMLRREPALCQTYFKRGGGAYKRGAAGGQQTALSTGERADFRGMGGKGITVRARKGNSYP